MSSRCEKVVLSIQKRLLTSLVLSSIFFVVTKSMTCNLGNLEKPVNSNSFIKPPNLIIMTKNDQVKYVTFLGMKTKDEN